MGIRWLLASHLSLCGADLRCCDSNSDGKAAIVGEELGQRGVEDEAVSVSDHRVHALKDGPGGGLPFETPMVSVKLQAIGEAVGLGGGPNQHHGGKELGVPFMPLLFPKHQQKMVAKAGVHDDPVSRGGEVHVRGQEHYLGPLKDVNPVYLAQVGHHHLQVAFPRAGEQGAQASCHLGGVQLRLVVVQVVRVCMVVQVVLGAVLLTVVVGEVVMGTAALLWRALSDGPAAGHTLQEKEKNVSGHEASLSAWLRLPWCSKETLQHRWRKLYFLKNEENRRTVFQSGSTV